jgi:hypothetical protein
MCRSDTSEAGWLAGSCAPRAQRIPSNPIRIKDLQSVAFAGTALALAGDEE